MNCNKKDPIQARFFMLNEALATDDSRKCLQHIYCDGEKIVSTNGKILVIADNREHLEKGFYDLATAGTGRNKRMKFVPVADEKAKEWDYPNWKQVVPDCTNCKTLEFHGDTQSPELEVFKLQFALASMGTGALIAQYFIDLICKPQLDYTVKITDGFSPIVFELPDFYTFMMMPVRSNERSAVKILLDDFKSDAIAEWERTHDAETNPAALEPAPEPQAEIAEEPANPAPEEPVDAAPAPEPEAPAALPEKRKEAPKRAAKTKRRTQKPAFSYHCELKNGERITLDSIKAVKARKDVVTCRIEPVKRSRKAA